jgi:RluA family pseudouridine synthase
VNNDANFELLYIDADVLIVNKPSGLRTIQDGYDPSLPCLKELLSRKYGKGWVVHRLDKDTSGVILFARHAEAHRVLNRQFETHTVRKIYLALAHGFPCWDQKTILAPLQKNGDRSHRTVINIENGKPAYTDIAVVKRFKNHTLFALEIKTGITHQIRTHLAMIGFPIVGDPLYSFFSMGISTAPQEICPDQLYLHAFSIDFQHPTNHEYIHIEALLPAYFHHTLENL